MGTASAMTNPSSPRMAFAPSHVVQWTTVLACRLVDVNWCVDKTSLGRVLTDEIRAELERISAWPQRADRYQHR